MKNYKRLEVWAVQVVTFLFAAFGGFLTRIAPPDQTGASYDVGILSFLVLVLLLIISALAKQAPSKAYRKRWLAAGAVCFLLALPGAVLYYETWQENTYSYPPEKPMVQHVRGSDKDRAELAQNWVREHPNEASPADLEANMPYEKIWKPEAIARANRRLLLNYGWVVLSLATATFCLIEANAGSGQETRKAGIRAGAVQRRGT
jgi:hypothetical protein